MAIITNTSVLIFLSKLNKLGLLVELFGEIFTTDEVSREILAGIKYGHMDALLVKKAMEDKKIKIIKIGKRKGLDGLGAGERSVLFAAVEQKINTVILDDGAAIKTARYLGLKVISTPFVLLRALLIGKIRKNEFMELFEGLVQQFDYRISPVIYKKIIDAAEKIN